ncbi:MAG: hypothetical protein U9Q80_08595 [Bacillota bacterium]|nr:hypothetical protein [Bacillota bacterium]
MIELKLADRQFVFNDDSYANYYEYFICVINQEIVGLLQFEIDTPSLTDIEFIEEHDTFINKDSLTRASLNYMLVHDYRSCMLNSEQFRFFIDKYADKNVFDNNFIDLEKFFSLGCAH